MKTTVLTTELKTALNKLSKFFNGKGLQLATNVKVVTNEEGTFLEVFRINEFEIHATVKVNNYKFETQGKETYDFKKLFNFVKKSKCNTFTFTELCVTSGKTSLKQSFSVVEDFPIKADVEKEIATLPKNNYKVAVNKTVYATGNKKSTESLRGINHTFNNGKISMVATDSFRMARFVVDASLNENEELNSIINGEFLKKMVSVFDKNNSDLKIYENTKSLKYKFDDMEIIVNKIDLSYPNVQQLIDKNTKSFSTCAMVNKSELINGLEMLDIIDNSETTNMNIDNQFIKMQRADETDSVENSFDVKKFEGESNDLNFNGEFLKEVLKVIDGENIELKLNSGIVPFVVKSEEFGIEKELHLIMPIRKY